MKATARFDANRLVRDALLARGDPSNLASSGYAYRPFDNRWLYWEAGDQVTRRESAPTTSHMCLKEICGLVTCSTEITPGVVASRK